MSDNITKQATYSIAHKVWWRGNAIIGVTIADTTPGVTIEVEWGDGHAAAALRALDAAHAELRAQIVDPEETTP